MRCAAPSPSRRPRLAVAGLNPHAGESGALGDDESRIIQPAIDALRQDGEDVSGPWPPDTMFTPAARTRYDVAICMYHDQALIPLKTLDMDQGVNVTLGLPIIRTSPDHGTAFDIAGKGIANPSSLIAALRLAARTRIPPVTAARQDRGRHAHARGSRRKTRPAAALEQDGWTIRARRVRTAAGEADLVAEKDGLLAVIEVKARPNLSDAAFALTPQQQARLVAATDIILAEHPDWGRNGVRFDLLVVDAAGNVRRIADAFRGW